MVFLSAHIKNSLFTFCRLLLWCILLNWNILWCNVFILLCFFLFLGLLLLKVSFLDFLLGFFKNSISFSWIFLLSSLDFIQTHTNNSFLNFSCFSGSFFLDIIYSDFLVMSSPCLGPGEFNWLDFLVE